MIKFTIYVAALVICIAFGFIINDLFQYSFLHWLATSALRGVCIVTLMGLMSSWYPTQVYEARIPWTLKRMILTV
ncbi:hypothetical protein [Ewingella americana]|uniref:Uncharacterized protein n=1 Tax=Ewingella americana TaxID=41202 RepID=A0A502GD99_9GAMM|nr:hypothetical protein [Ewingella americana]TPG59905.1 hypothetical protein EAH77_15170 [Ewingella americana]